ncbi:hypothetical protein ABPG74_013171 [Tetrahymena malaccensis]
MSFNQQHFNPYQQGQQYTMPYQMAGQTNQNQQFYNNHVNQQQQHDDFGDFISSSSQNNQNTSAQNKYDAFNNLQGPSGFAFNESPQKPAQKQGQNQMFMNNQVPNNFNVQAQNNLATVHANGQYGYGNTINQNASIQNMNQHHNQQQYQVYQQQQLQQQQFQQTQVYQHQAHHMNQNQVLHQQFQQNQLQHLQNPLQVNQFYAQNQAQMAQLALNNPQYQAQLNLAAQQQKNDFGDDFGDFSTASTVQNAHQMTGGFNSNGQPVQQTINQYQLNQNFQSQGYSIQGQNIQQNLTNMGQSAQIQDKHSQINNAFNTVQHPNLQQQNNYHHQMNQQQLNWQQIQNPIQQVQKNSDDFGDFNDAPSNQNNSNVLTQNQNQFQSMPQIHSTQNINSLQQAQIAQPQIAISQVQQQNKLTDIDDDFGDFTSHQSSTQATAGLHNLQSNNQNALNIQSKQQNLGVQNVQQQQPKIVKQDSDDFGDFTTVQTTIQQPQNGIQPVLPNTLQGLSQTIQSNTNPIQQTNQIQEQQQNVNQVLQQNNLQALQNAFGSIQISQQEKDNNKKQSDDFGDFEVASGTIQNNLSNLGNNEKVIHNQLQNSAQKSDGFGEFTDAQPQAATHVSSFNQTQQNSLPSVNHIVQNNNAPQQKVSDDFGDFQDINTSSQQQIQQNQQNSQQEGFKKYNAFYELEQKAQESKPKVSVLDMPLDMMANQQQNNSNQQKNQDLFGNDNNENEDDFGDFQDIKTENLIQQQTQQQQQLLQQKIQNQNHRFHSDQQYNNISSQPQFNPTQIVFNSQLPTVKKSGAEFEKELIGDVISLFDDYKVDHLTDKNKMFQNQNTQQVLWRSTNFIQFQQNVQHQNNVKDAKDDQFGDFEDFQDSKQQEKVVVQPIHAHELDWDSIIKQNQQVENDLQPQDQLQDEFSQQGQQESKLNANKKNHQNDLFEDHSSQNNAKATSSIQDNNQGDHTSSQADTLTLDFERNLKAKKNQKKNDFEDDLQAEIEGDDDFGDFETSNKHQQVLNVPPQNNYPIFQNQATNNNVMNNNDDLFEEFEQATYQPQQSNIQAQNNILQSSNQQNNQKDDDLFGDFQDIDQTNQQKQPQQQKLNENQNDEFDEFEEFTEAPTQQNQQEHKQMQQQAPKQEEKIMDLKQFEMNTFDITALDYGESAKQKAEQQKREQERKKQEEEERKRQQMLELELQKQQKLNQIPQFNVGKQIYKGEYWRKVYENDERYYVDSKFYEDLIQEIDSLGLYQHFEKLITIREGLDQVENLEQQRKKAKNEQNYDRQYQLKQQIDEIESQKDYKAEMMSLVYQVIACEGKCFNHLIYDRIRSLENAMIFVKQFQKLHDQNRDVDEMIDFMIITTTIDNNYSSYVHKLYQVQEVCQKELQQFESKMKQFHSLPTQAKQQIVSQKQFTDFIKASTQILYHGKRYSKISASLSSQSIDFDTLEKIVTNNILILNKQFNTNFEQIKKNFSFTEELTQEQREKLINDIVNRESNLHLNEFICNLCLGVANNTRVHYRGKHYHNLCINIWFNKISTIIE